jgi:hypothetical protein
MLVRKKFFYKPSTKRLYNFSGGNDIVIIEKPVLNDAIRQANFLERTNGRKNNFFIDR